ncbi:MAG: hypothetical protein JXK07_11465 [Spirochaetes bacterium]|nr:hypothetical protein [Spirochaetota bacterium]
MRIDPTTLPDDPAVLKEMLLALNTANNTIQNKYSHLEEQHSHLETEYNSLRQKLADFKRMLFGWSFRFAPLLAQATRAQEVKNCQKKRWISFFCLMRQKTV